MLPGEVEGREKKTQKTSHVVVKVERGGYDSQFMETKGNFKYSNGIFHLSGNG